MKKLLPFLSILCFIMFFSLDVNAQVLPEISSATFEVIEGGLHDLTEVGTGYKGFSPYTDMGIMAYEVIGRAFQQLMNISDDSVALWTCDDDDCIVEPISDNEYTSLITSYTYITDRNGDLVDKSNIYRVSYDNGYFNGVCYIDNYGFLLYTDSINNQKRALANAAFGGSMCDLGEWNNFYDLLDNQLDTHGMCISDSNVDFNSTSLMYWCGAVKNGGSHVYRETIYFYCPNMYDPGVIMALNDTLYWYYNDSSAYTLDWKSYSDGVLQNGNYYYLGGKYNGTTFENHHYDYSIRLNSVSSYLTNLSYSQFMGYTPPADSKEYKFVFAYNNFQFDSSVKNQVLQGTNNFFMPLQFPNGSVWPWLNGFSEVDLNTLHEFAETLRSANPEINPNYDPNEELTPDNYPITKPIQVPTINPMPLPNPNPVPDITPDSSYDPDVDPESDPMSEPIPDSSLDDTTPTLIRGLQNRFPFCIPWDINQLLNNLVSEPEPPAWNFDYTISCFGHEYTTHVEGDLSDYNDLAALLRKFELILFMIGIMYFSYKHFI